MENKNAFGHKIRKHDSVSDRWVFQSRTICIGDRFHQQPNDVFATREKLFKQIAGRLGLIVVKVHASSGVEKLVDRFLLNIELGRQQLGEIFTVKRGREREHRVVEPHAF